MVVGISRRRRLSVASSSIGNIVVTFSWHISSLKVRSLETPIPYLELHNMVEGDNGGGGAAASSPYFEFTQIEGTFAERLVNDGE